MNVEASMGVPYRRLEKVCTSEVSDGGDATSEFVFVWLMSLCHHRVGGSREGRMAVSSRAGDLVAGF